MDRKKQAGYEKPVIDEIEALSMQLLAANRQLEEVNEKLRQSEKARGEMLANLSHDLRAPLTAFRSAVDYLQSRPDAPESERTAMLLVMDRRCAAMERMAEDLHLLTAMDVPDFGLQREKLKLAPFLEEYFTMQQMNDAFGGRRLVCEVPPRLAGTVDADAKALLRVLDNLFANALRFTQPGDEIALGCRAAGNELEFYVRDSGCGIPHGQQEAIFERTHTVSLARTPKPEGAGSGLGLAIVRSIVEKHDGRVWCKSVLHQGSTFTVRLPALAE